MEVSGASVVPDDWPRGNSSGSRDTSQGTDIIELPIVSHYTNGFLETITEEGSEFETSEDGSAFDVYTDTRQREFCQSSSQAIIPNVDSDRLMSNEPKESEDYEEVMNISRYCFPTRPASNGSNHNTACEVSSKNETEPSDNSASGMATFSVGQRNLVPFQKDGFTKHSQSYSKVLPKDINAFSGPRQYSATDGSAVDRAPCPDRPDSDSTTDLAEEVLVFSTNDESSEWCWRLQKEHNLHTTLQSSNLDEGSKVANNTPSAPSEVQASLMMENKYSEGRHWSLTDGASNLLTKNELALFKSPHLFQPSNMVQRLQPSTGCGAATSNESLNIPFQFPLVVPSHAAQLTPPPVEVRAFAEHAHRMHFSNPSVRVKSGYVPPKASTCRQIGDNTQPPSPFAKQSCVCTANGRLYTDHLCLSSSNHSSHLRNIAKPLGLFPQNRVVRENDFKTSGGLGYNSPHWSLESILLQQQTRSQDCFACTIPEIPVAFSRARASREIVPPVMTENGIITGADTEHSKVQGELQSQTELPRERATCPMPPNLIATNERQLLMGRQENHSLPKSDGLQFSRSQQQTIHLEENCAVNTGYHPDATLRKSCTQAHATTATTLLYPYGIVSTWENSFGYPMRMESKNLYEPITSKISQPKRGSSIESSSPVWVASSTPRSYMDRKFSETITNGLEKDKEEARGGINCKMRGHKRKANFKHPLLKPLQRSPAVLGVSELLLKTDEELNKLMSGMAAESPVIEQHTHDYGRSENYCPTEYSPVRRCFPMHSKHLFDDIPADWENDTSETRSYFDYGGEEEDDDFEDLNSAVNMGSKASIGQIPASSGSKHCERRTTALSNETQLLNMPYEEASKILDDILKLKTDERGFRWTDNCQARAVHNNDTEMQTSRFQEVAAAVKRTVFDSWDLPYIDSDVNVVEQSSSPAPYQPVLADIDEITLTSRNSQLQNSWSSASDMNCVVYQSNRVSLNRHPPVEYYRNHPQSDRVKRVRIRFGLCDQKNANTVDSNSSMKIRNGKFLWLQRLCGCVRSPRDRKRRHF
ncbi:unnamed protein product [Dicrocoelium dendriticum]|nr:unnamed protein product [Dicrocoelium dendriticum]